LPYKFEVYGVDDYLTDFYNDTMDVYKIGQKIAQSRESRDWHHILCKTVSEDSFVFYLTPILSSEP